MPYTTQQKWRIESLWETYCSDSSSLIPSASRFSSFSQLFPHPLFPTLHFVKTLSPQRSSHPVFFDEGEGFFGLKHHQVTLVKGKPVYLFDNHNYALIAFAQLKEYCRRTFDVVHIDAHRDDAVFPYSITGALSLSDIPELLVKTRVSDYLDVATRGNLIAHIFSYTQSFEFDVFTIPSRPYILNLDLDIFSEEGGCVALEKKVQVIAKAWNHADAVILATSPGYMLQNDAFWLAKLFFGQK